jgi:pimeloyl-ACP methyl ester carboxylesterase
MHKNNCLVKALVLLALCCCPFVVSAQELAIPGKICIVGGSYGGYASLMAAAKQQDTFSCAASINGVSDQWEVWASARRYMSKEIIRKQLGTDKEDLIARSPISYAKTIDIPVLLIHGKKTAWFRLVIAGRWTKHCARPAKQSNLLNSRMAIIL